MTRPYLEDERTAESFAGESFAGGDYAGDQAQGPGPDDADRRPRRARQEPDDGAAGERRGGRRRGYFRWLLDIAATTPRLM
jgi:hypothetical protein